MKKIKLLCLIAGILAVAGCDGNISFSGEMNQGDQRPEIVLSPEETPSKEETEEKEEVEKNQGNEDESHPIVEKIVDSESENTNDEDVSVQTDGETDHKEGDDTNTDGESVQTDGEDILAEDENGQTDGEDPNTVEETIHTEDETVQSDGENVHSEGEDIQTDDENVQADDEIFQTDPEESNGNDEENNHISDLNEDLVLSFEDFPEIYGGLADGFNSYCLSTEPFDFWTNRQISYNSDVYPARDNHCHNSILIKSVKGSSNKSKITGIQITEKYYKDTEGNLPALQTEEKSLFSEVFESIPGSFSYSLSQPLIYPFKALSDGVLQLEIALVDEFDNLSEPVVFYVVRDTILDLKAMQLGLTMTSIPSGTGNPLRSVSVRQGKSSYFAKNDSYCFGTELEPTAKDNSYFSFSLSYGSSKENLKETEIRVRNKATVKTTFEIEVSPEESTIVLLNVWDGAGNKATEEFLIPGNNFLKIDGIEKESYYTVFHLDQECLSKITDENPAAELSYRWAYDDKKFNSWTNGDSVRILSTKLTEESRLYLQPRLLFRIGDEESYRDYYLYGSIKEIKINQLNFNPEEEKAAGF